MFSSATCFVASAPTARCRKDRKAQGLEKDRTKQRKLKEKGRTGEEKRGTHACTMLHAICTVMHACPLHNYAVAIRTPFQSILRLHSNRIGAVRAESETYKREWTCLCL
eukprot:364496-Chlamydomonas_euryale.AAC.61